jgi:hypothetical protein
MSFANYLLTLDDAERLSENRLGFFERGEALLLQGCFGDASVYFKKLVVGAAGRLRHFYESLADVCSRFESAESSQWRDAIASLSAYVVKEDVKEQRLVEMLQGRVPALVKYFQSDDAALWGGRSWPRLLAAVLWFHEPLAKRHVLSQLAQRCAAAFGVESDSDAALAALEGESMKAVQLVYNHEPLCEALIGELLARIGAIESPSLKDGNDLHFQIQPWNLDARQLLWTNLALSIGFGPGRVWQRPSEDDNALSFRYALRFLSRARLTEAARAQHELTLVDCTFACSERMAISILDVMPLQERSCFIRRRVVQLAKHDIVTACRWAAFDVRARQFLVDAAVTLFLDNEAPSKRRVDPWALGFAQSPEEHVILKLLRARELFSAGGDVNQAVELISDCLEYVSTRYRHQILRKLLGLEGHFGSTMPVITLNSETCLRLMHSLHSSNPKGVYEDRDEVRAVLMLMFSEALRRESRQGAGWM